MAIKLNQRKYL